MKQINKIFYIIVIFLITIYISNRIIGSIISDKISGKMEEVLLENGFIAIDENKRHIFRNNIIGEISYHDITVNPLNASINIHELILYDNLTERTLQIESLNLKTGYSEQWHENVVNSVVIFRGIFNLAYPGWAMTYMGTFLAGLWGFVHGFLAGFLIAIFYNIFSKVFNRS